MKLPQDKIEEKEIEWNAESFGKFYQDYQVRITYFAFRFTRSLQEAEDIVSIAFEKLWLRKDQFKTTSDFAAFLYTIVKNASCTYLTLVKSKKSITNLRTLELDENSEFFIDENSMQFEIMRSELLHLLFIEIKKLTPALKSVAELTYIEGLSAKEVSDKLNIAIQTVQNNKHLVSKIIRKELGKNTELF